MANKENLIPQAHVLTVDELRKGEQKSGEAKFIKRQRRKEGVYGKNGTPSKGNKREAV